MTLVSNADAVQLAALWMATPANTWSSSALFQAIGAPEHGRHWRGGISQDGGVDADGNRIFIPKVGDFFTPNPLHALGVDLFSTAWRVGSSAVAGEDRVTSLASVFGEMDHGTIEEQLLRLALAVVLGLVSMPSAIILSGDTRPGLCGTTVRLQEGRSVHVIWRFKKAWPVTEYRKWLRVQAYLCGVLLGDPSVITKRAQRMRLGCGLTTQAGPFDISRKKWIELGLAPRVQSIIHLGERIDGEALYKIASGAKLVGEDALTDEQAKVYTPSSSPWARYARRLDLLGPASKRVKKNAPVVQVALLDPAGKGGRLDPELEVTMASGTRMTVAALREVTGRRPLAVRCPFSNLHKHADASASASAFKGAKVGVYIVCHTCDAVWREHVEESAGRPWRSGAARAVEGNVSPVSDADPYEGSIMDLHSEGGRRYPDDSRAASGRLAQEAESHQGGPPSQPSLVGSRLPALAMHLTRLQLAQDALRGRQDQTRRALWKSQKGRFRASESVRAREELCATQRAERAKLEAKIKHVERAMIRVSAIEGARASEQATLDRLLDARRARAALISELVKARAEIGKINAAEADEFWEAYDAAREDTDPSVWSQVEGPAWDRRADEMETRHAEALDAAKKKIRAALGVDDAEVLGVAEVQHVWQPELDASVFRRDKKLIFVWSGLGTKKTGAAQRLIETVPTAVCVAPLVTLVRGIAGRFKIPCYDQVSAPGDEGKAVVAARKIAVTLDSLRRVVNEAPDVVLLDEVERIFAHLIGDTMFKNDLSGNYEKKAELLVNAGQVLALDAYMSPVSVRAIRRLLGRDPDTSAPDELLVKNHWFDPERAFILHDSQVDLVDHVVKLASKGKRLCIFSPSKRVTKKLKRLLATHAPHARTWVINADTSSKDAEKIRDINQTIELEKIDVLIASPSITSGVSINLDGWFDETVIIAPGPCELPVGDLLQMGGRCRRPKSKVIHAFVAKTDRRYLETAREIREAWERQERAAPWFEAMKQHQPELATHRLDEALLATACEVEAAKRKATNRLREAFEALLDAEGVPYVVRPAPSRMKLKKIQEQWRTVAKTVADERATSIANAPEITLAQAEEEKRKPGRDSAAIERALVCDFYGKADFETVLDDDEGRRRKGLRRLTYLRAYRKGDKAKLIQSDLSSSDFSKFKVGRRYGTWSTQAAHLLLTWFGLSGDVESWCDVEFAEVRPPKDVNAPTSLWVRSDAKSPWRNVTDDVAKVTAAHRGRLQRDVGDLPGGMRTAPVAFLTAYLSKLGIEPTVTQRRAPPEKRVTTMIPPRDVDLPGKLKGKAWSISRTVIDLALAQAERGVRPHGTDVDPSQDLAGDQAA